MNTEFKVGDAVILKSGGPRMTIETLESGRADCVWFVRDLVFRERFAIALLTVPPKPFATLVR